MSQLVARSRAKNEAGAPATPPAPAKPTETPPAPVTGAPATPPTPPPEPAKLTDLLSKSLRFGTRGAPKPDPAAPVTPAVPATPATPAPDFAPPTAPVTQPVPAKKKAVKRAAPAVDPAAIASAAATAATEAAVRAMTRVAPPAPTPTDDLTDGDRRDYEIAEHLAKIDPRFKDAPKVILDQVRQADDYAQNWSTANPGKVFNPEDEEHDNFFAQMQRPWTDSEFRRAEVKLEARKEIEEMSRASDQRLSVVEEDSARRELAPAVDQHFSNAALQTAKMVGDDIHQALSTGGWDALHKKDPVMAKVLGTALQQMHPFVEAAIQIDDPRQRIRIDPNNPAHQQWNKVVQVGEAELVGQTNEQGQKFARRADWVRMTPAQQAGHWYLTADMMIQGAMEYAADEVKKISAEQTEYLKSLGYVRQEPAAAPVAGAANGTPATPTPAPAPTIGVPAGGNKPVSPTVGSGAKIDDTGGAPKTGDAALMQQISGILFRR